LCYGEALACFDHLLVSGKIKNIVRVLCQDCYRGLTISHSKREGSHYSNNARFNRKLKAARNARAPERQEARLSSQTGSPQSEKRKGKRRTWRRLIRLGIKFRGARDHAKGAEGLTNYGTKGTLTCRTSRTEKQKAGKPTDHRESMDTRGALRRSPQTKGATAREHIERTASGEWSTLVEMERGETRGGHHSMTVGVGTIGYGIDG